MIREISPQNWLSDAICMISEKKHSDLSNYAEALDDMLDEIDTALRIGSLDENLDIFEKEKWITTQQRLDIEMIRDNLLSNDFKNWTPEGFDNDATWKMVRAIAQSLKSELGISPYYKEVKLAH